MGTAMSRIPLICPRCGLPQRVLPGGPERLARVVHVGTGREACGPADPPPDPLADLPPGADGR
ncbi:hypothetical protein [Kitasatospora sp. NE20-6]|uniref:hypothetical protein n=1 Tax=Kitasatospora sp. NE20-6 TaxID=2859066 RepID=UPI0038B36F85